MLIELEDERGCLEIFDTDVANFEDAVEALEQTAGRLAKASAALYASGLIVGNDGFLVIFDGERASAWFRSAETI